MINSDRRQVIPAFPVMKKYRFNIANRRNAVFLLYSVTQYYWADIVENIFR